MPGKKNTKLEDPLVCPKEGCGGKLDDKKHKCTCIPEGKYLGSGTTLGNHVLKKGLYGGNFKNHPFYVKVKGYNPNTDRNGIEAHHLVSSASLVQKEEYKRLVYMFGYNINHRNNAVLLPTFMQVACAYGVPLHNGGHGATFILEKFSYKELRAIDNWSYSGENTRVKAIFPSYNLEDEIATLNYEDHVNKIVANQCDSFLEKEICDADKRLSESKEFICAMDKLSQVVFKKIATFLWTLTSDGLDYAPGGIGCCKEITLPEKREAIKNFLEDIEINPLNDDVKSFFGAIYSDADIYKLLTDKNYFRCTAGCGIDSHVLKVHFKNTEHLGDKTTHESCYNKTTHSHFEERKNIEKFTGFK